MVRFAIELCQLQHKSGRHFIFEQPQSSRAWSLGEVIKLTYRDGVTKTTFHQCMYGLEARDHAGVAPAYKPTSVLTNHPALVEVLQERCDGSHRHAQLIGKSACTQAARYPSGLCTAVMKGVQVIRKRLEEIASVRDKLHEAHLCESVEGNSFTALPFTDGGLDVCPEDVLYEIEMEDMCEQDPSTWEDLATQRWQEYSQFSNETVDSTTGEILDPAKVKAGCDEELGFMSHMHVWDKVTREQAQSDPDGKIVGTRWVFVKKGDKVRCRLVAQEFAGSDKREDLYAGTPPLSATRYLLSDSVSRGRKNKRLKLMVVDVKRAFLHGYCTRSVYIELPGAESQGGEICWQARQGIVRDP